MQRSHVQLLGFAVTITAIIASSGAWADQACGAGTPEGVNCSCELRTLRPLQGAVGMAEVRDKAAKIAAKPDKEAKDLANDPIKLVRGPGGDLFITDHHHGARAWLLAGTAVATCRIDAGPPTADPAQFWAGLATPPKLHLKDADGHDITPEALPKSLEQLHDDPFRSLAWMIRKDNGFCRATMAQKEFAEFLWADWLRVQPGLPHADVAADPRKVLPAAKLLVKSPAASGNPGYVADPATFKCPKDD
jgi:hypothetical protein